MTMPATMWTLIAEARGGGPEAVDTLLRRYRAPILAYVRRAGLPAEEAEDVVQEAFLAIVEEGVLAKADRALGRFRHLLLAVTRHVISERRRHEGRLKRGGGRTRIAVGDGEDGPRLEDLLAAPSADDAFDPLWVQNLVFLAMERLREDCTRDGVAHYAKALFLATTRGLGQAEIAAELGAAPHDVKNWLHQARLRLRRLVLAEIQRYSSSREEYDAEVAYLRKFLE